MDPSTVVEISGFTITYFEQIERRLQDERFWGKRKAKTKYVFIVLVDRWHLHEALLKLGGKEIDRARFVMVCYVLSAANHGVHWNEWQGTKALNIQAAILYG